MACVYVLTGGDACVRLCGECEGCVCVCFDPRIVRCCRLIDVKMWTYGGRKERECVCTSFKQLFVFRSTTILSQEPDLHPAYLHGQQYSIIIKLL